MPIWLQIIMCVFLVVQGVAIPILSFKAWRAEKRKASERADTPDLCTVQGAVEELLYGPGPKADRVEIRIPISDGKVARIELKITEVNDE